MKKDRSLFISFVLLVLIASLYRVLPGRPMGFAPQIAMALFGGAVMIDKKMSFILPLLSMFVSDLLYQWLYLKGLTPIRGFYDGQLLNYVLFGLVTVIGFVVKKDKMLSIANGAVLGATFYFIVSNFLVWVMGGLDIHNLPYPKTFSGLMECYAAGLPFYRNSFLATLCFSGILFGGYYLINRNAFTKKAVVA